ncbi:hypothetical protein PGB90_007557 [Kerria lacca]
MNESQNNHLVTHLNIFKDLVQLRKNIVFQQGDLHLYVLSNWVFSFVRSYVDHGTFVIIINFGSEITISNLHTHRPSLPKHLSVVIASVNSKYVHGDVLATNSVKLRPKAAVVLTTSEEDYDNQEYNIDNLKHEVFSL